MNLSPDPQLATSTMDYDALLLKETKTNNDNVYLKSLFEELKESHQDLISQLEKNKIINSQEWFETGDISSSLKKYEYLKEENAMLKEVQKSNQSIREEYEKEMRDIKIAMGCDGPLSWDIKDILNWIEEKEEQLEATHNCSQQANADYERLVDKNNNDNLNFGDILSEREEEIEDLKKKVANNKRFTDNAVTTLLHKGWTKGECGVWCEPKSQPRDEEDNDGYREEVAELKEKVANWEHLTSEAVEVEVREKERLKAEVEAHVAHLDEFVDENNQLKEEAVEIAKLKSDNNNLMCVINHLKIDYKKVLKEMGVDCSPDAWDSM